MARSTSAARYSVGEEIAHTITHGLGALLSIVGLVFLVQFSSRYGNAWHIVSCSIYGATLILCYTASTLYHGVPIPRLKPLLQQIDHATIFLLIAGTYTPFALVCLRDSLGLPLLALVWAVALYGVKRELSKKERKSSVFMYLGLGWLAVFAIKPLFDRLETGGVVLLLVGGLFYTVGVLFYVRKRMPYHHAIWHLFVLAGSIFQFFSIFLYVVPDGA
ncbi:MAG: hemolysin III [Myxococcales bacterium]|nr:hemolysin III [Myxococcales bacterium]